MASQSIFAPRYLALSIGIILAAMTIGFEGLAVTTVAPAIAGDLQGIHLFGWIFSAYLLAQIVGTLVIGRQIDRKGPALLFTIAIILFAVGLIIAAIASNMYVLIASRALQGFGAGAMYTCIYTAISLSYPDALRAKILGALGTAYVLPSMLGPYVAGLIASQWSWRFVFWGVLPFLLLAVLLSLPVFRKLKMPDVVEKKEAGVIGMSVVLAVGTGIFLSGLGMLPKMLGAVLLLIGLLLMAQPLRKLLPKGTMVFRPGLSSLIASRGLFFAAYVCTQNFLVLALTDTKGLAADHAGLVVASAALSWCIVAILQARWDAADQGRGRNKRIIAGIMLMLLGIGIMVFVPTLNVVLAVIGEIIAGIGIGLAHTTSGTVAFSLAKEGEAGQVSGSLQFADSFTPGVAIGIGGAIIAISQTAAISMEAAITLAMVFNIVLVLLSLLASSRTKLAQSSSQEPQAGTVRNEI
ncbi:MFS transporter [Paenibacillus aquistagni]|uniref:Major Facilitator Superfamily protein n=1 Tax=Paenibacillus aquistagni TaxID=1852522 RepID=A0A1X7J9P1_9BACL|nr:MFS transporter [Paenibacillus aquistagni]SMG24250.1 Major Facilitator Superfamily protein [Paenibacillus aquistagni]